MTNTDPIGLYIHWPYCTRLCPYCDFNIFRQRGADKALVQALLEDIHWWADQIGKRPLSSIYFGGGTPSLLAPEDVNNIIHLCKNVFGLRDNEEITIEANPTDAEAGKLHAFREAGINRLSLGIQSLDDDILKFLGRNHNAAEARRAVEKAVKIFENCSFDLIYATPDQQQAQWRAALTDAISLGSPHISLYQLTIEDGTAFKKAVQRGDWQPLPDEQEACLYDLAQEICAAEGFIPYEISNFARPGFESTHNLLYWRHHEFIGIGPGAHSRINKGGQRWAAQTLTHPKAYATEAPGERFVLEALTKEDQATEFLLMGLRLKEGIDIKRYETIGGKSWPAKQSNILIKDGLAEHTDTRLRLTPKGRLLLNSVVLDLMDS